MNILNIFIIYNYNKKKLMYIWFYYKDYLEKNKYNVSLIKFSNKLNLKKYECLEVQIIKIKTYN